MLALLGIPDDAFLIRFPIMFGCFAIALLLMFWSRLFDPEERLIQDQDPSAKTRKNLKKGLRWVRKSPIMMEPTITDAAKGAFSAQVGFPS